MIWCGRMCGLWRWLCRGLWRGLWRWLGRWLCRGFWRRLWRRRGCGLRHAVIVFWVEGTAEYEPSIALTMVSMAVKLNETGVRFVSGLDASPTLVVTRSADRRAERRTHWPWAERETRAHLQRPTHHGPNPVTRKVTICSDRFTVIVPQCP